jgi:Flp pilus assembly protein TadG
MHVKGIRRRNRRLGASDRRATAVMEFAIAAPALLYFFVAASDFGLASWKLGCVANAVAQGGYYAFRTGPTVSQSAVKALVQNASSVSIPAANITTTDPTQCYCPSGTPATLGTAQANCTTTCSDGTTPGNYMTIAATYRLTGFFSSLGLTKTGETISESVTVRLK